MKDDRRRKGRSALLVPPSASLLRPFQEGCSMRSALLCCVALLCAAGAAQAQGWPAPQGYYPNAAYYPNGGYYPNAGPAPGPEFYGAQPPPFAYSNGFYHFQQYTPPEPGTAGEPREWPEGPPKKPSWVYARFDYLFAKLRTPDN